MKSKILELIPESETDLRNSIENSIGTRESITQILLKSFGLNKSIWKDWQKQVEVTMLSIPDEEFNVSEKAANGSISLWLESSVGKSFDTDGHYGPQCKDFVNAYSLWLGYPLKPSDAAKTWETEQLPFWQKIPNQSGLIPNTGDIVIWDSWAENPYGHIAVVLEATTNKFRSVDQNWDTLDISKGSPAAIIEHSYTNPTILGYLRPTVLSGQTQ